MLTPEAFSGLQTACRRMPPEQHIQLLEQAAAAHPDDARVWTLLGAALHRAGRLEAALNVFDQMLARDPADLQALNAKSSLLAALGRGREALALLEQTASRFPCDATVLANLGLLCEREAKDLNAALERYDAALALDPGHRAALMNRGALLCLLGRPAEAVENNRRLVQLAPADAAAHFNLADALLAARRFEEGLLACDAAIALDGSLSRAYIDRALANIALGRLDAAQRDLSRVRDTDPAALEDFQLGFSRRAGGLFHRFDARSLYLHMLYAQIAECDWSRRDEFVAAFERLILERSGAADEIQDPNLSFKALGFPIAQSARKALAVAVARGTVESAARLGCGPWVAAGPRRDRLRLGYVSPDFRRHPCAYLTRRLYGSHDRGRFEVYAYALHPDDASAVRRDIEAGCDLFRDVSACDSRAIVEQIRGDGIDIAIDLSGYTNFTRPEIFGCRVAPVQTLYLGYPGSMGANHVDYAIVDRVVCPADADAWWTEKLVRLPDSYFVVNDREKVVAWERDRAALGLPPAGFVFCCFNNPYKIDPATFGIWMRLLGRVPGSVLWTLKTADAVETNLRREAALRGVGPERLVFAPFMPERERHLGRYGFVDLMLDSRDYNAHTTAIDALWCGVPVITVPGDTMAARVGASLLGAAGLPELVCRDWVEYEEKSVRLATHPAELAALKAKLAANRDACPLFDTEARVRQLEAAFAEMWRRHLAGLPPASFEVKRQPKPEFRNRWH